MFMTTLKFTETLLNGTIINRNLFLDSNFVFRANSDYLTSNTKNGGGELIAVSKSFQGV